MHKYEYVLSYIVPFGFYILRLTPFDFFEVKWKNSHIFKSFLDARTKSHKSKGVIKGQGGQRCEARSKVINFIF